MANLTGQCVICGASPTVKAHLFPRALVKRIRGDEKNLVEGSKRRAGIKLTQSGHWDDELLCELHESAFGSIDDYAARFWRRFERFAQLSETGNSYIVANPRPDLLLKFAYATVWRYVASKEGSEHGLDLGPYRESLEQILFAGAAPDLQVLVGRSNLVDPRGKRVEIGLPPYKRKLLNWNVWHFTIAGFDFFLKTDKRPFPPQWDDFLVNNNDPVIVPLMDPVRFDSVPMFKPIFLQMLKVG